MRREIFYSLPIHVFGEIHLQKEKEVEFSKWFLFQRIAFPIFFSKIKLYCRKMAPAAKSRGFRERERNLIRGSVRKKKPLHFPDFFSFSSHVFSFIIREEMSIFRAPNFFPFFFLLLRSHNFRMEREREGKNRG